MTYLQLLKWLIKNNIIQSVHNLTYLIYDEPKMFTYSAVLKQPSDFKLKIPTGGFSFSSQKKALLSCLGETMERYALFNHKNFHIKKLVWQNSKNQTVDIRNYTKNPSLFRKEFGWIRVKELTSNKDKYLPAQLIFLNYRSFAREPELAPNISTGAAGDWKQNKSIIKGIMEIIERDAIMTAYLLKISFPPIKINSIPNRQIQNIAMVINKYQLEWNLFEVTNDLKIPVFISIVIDKTGVGPAVSSGSKADFSSIQAIIGSVEEAIAARKFARFYFHQNRVISRYGREKSINDFLFNRIFLWWPINSTIRLNFWLKNKPVPFKHRKTPENINDQLEVIKSTIKKFNLSCFVANITPNLFKKINYYVFKVVIPELQPFYLYEQKRFINQHRLKRVANYFKVPFLINQFPHPFP